MNEEKNCKMCGFMENHKGCKKGLAFLLALVLVFMFAKSFDDRGSKDAQKDTIVVSGKGELMVKPDIATLSFSVMEENMDVSKASDAVNTRMATIVESLKLNGVDEKDIKTTGYNIYPRYIYVNAQVTYPYGGKQVLAGYDVTDSIEVKVRDLSKASSVVTGLGALNVTDMSGLTFTEDKYNDLVRQARDQAIADARDQATKLAKALGVRLVKITAYSEGGNYPVMYGGGYAGISMAKESSAPAVLPTGENKISSSVSITYEIR